MSLIEIIIALIISATGQDPAAFSGQGVLTIDPITGKSEWIEKK